jgi:hypothetical protein
VSDPDRAIFERIAIDPSCAFCTGRENPPALEIDAAYCLTLAELPHRETHAIRHFHEIGLCPYVTVRRAKREKPPSAASLYSGRSRARPFNSRDRRSANGRSQGCGVTPVYHARYSAATG